MTRAGKQRGGAHECDRRSALAQAPARHFMRTRFSTSPVASDSNSPATRSRAGMVVPAGKLTLNAGTGVTILDNVLCRTAGSPLVINADYEVHGDGTLTVWSLVSFSSLASPYSFS